MLNKLLAKTSGVSLIQHTTEVFDTMKWILGNYPLSYEEQERLLLAAKLHDIGKITSKFQKFLKKGVNLYDNDKIKYNHNIIGWYFIKNYLDHKDKDKIANLVLWHHANYNSCERLNEEISKIRAEISDDDVQLMKAFCDYYLIPLLDSDYDVEITGDNEFYKVDNLERSILITSDVWASSSQNFKECFIKSIIDDSQINQDFLLSKRTIEQLNIVQQINEKTTTLIKAPAGFGKTMLGILWTLKRKSKLIWVCPTNVITETVYENILNDLKMLNLNISVELYLSGERKKANNSLNDFSSDIVVTNIDNFIKPSVTNSYGSRCLMIYDADVIFDEVHEYDSMDCALFSAFNNIMFKRHNILNTTTLLLTATPTTFRFLANKGKEIDVLPNKHEHYKAIHNEEYQIHFVDSIPSQQLNGEFVCFNNIVADVQRSYSTYHGDKLICHGRYLDEHKEENKNLVLNNYGKNGQRKPVGVFTNQMLTTACDYSVNKMFIKSPTLQSFFQSVGRLNRWGGMGLSHIYVVMDKSRSDSVFIGSENENKLQTKFIKEFSKEFDGKRTSLDELYCFYNKFIEANILIFKEISRDKNITSKRMLESIYAKKSKNGKSSLKVSNSNSLRKSTSADEIYIYVRRTNSTDFVTMSINVPRAIGNSKLFNEHETTYNEQIKLIKTFDSYNKYKNITPEIIRKEAIYYDSPYPVFNHVYDDKLGLCKINEEP